VAAIEIGSRKTGFVGDMSVAWIGAPHAARSATGMENNGLILCW
jgi:hypothetical protein